MKHETSPLKKSEVKTKTLLRSLPELCLLRAACTRGTSAVCQSVDDKQTHPFDCVCVGGSVRLGRCTVPCTMQERGRENVGETGDVQRCMHEHERAMHTHGLFKFPFPGPPLRRRATGCQREAVAEHRCRTVRLVCRRAPADPGLDWPAGQLPLPASGGGSRRLRTGEGCPHVTYVPLHPRTSTPTVCCGRDRSSSPRKGLYVLLKPL
jgi:hypothetical protein